MIATDVCSGALVHLASLLQEGHWSRDCPQSAGGPSSAGRGGGGYGGSSGAGGSSDVCYKCNQSVRLTRVSCLASPAQRVSGLLCQSRHPGFSRGLRPAQRYPVSHTCMLEASVQRVSTEQMGRPAPAGPLGEGLPQSGRWRRRRLWRLPRRRLWRGHIWWWGIIRGRRQILWAGVIWRCQWQRR